jgi:hypothetical protein
MQVGFAVARYPYDDYVDAAALAAMRDPEQQRRIQVANDRLQAAHNALGTTFLLLHLVRDKVLHLSTLNLDTMQPETPPASFWEVSIARRCLVAQYISRAAQGRDSRGLGRMGRGREVCDVTFTALAMPCRVCQPAHSVVTCFGLSSTRPCSLLQPQGLLQQQPGILNAIASSLLR